MNTVSKDAKLFDSIAYSYAKKDIMPSSRIARERQLFSALEPFLKKRHGVILDIGCGIAAPAKYLEGRYDSYIGIDHSQNLIEAARDFHKGNIKTRFIASDIKDPVLPKNTADLIISIGALHHIKDPDSAMAALVKFAKPGAVLVAIEPQSNNAFIQFLRKIRARLDRSYSDEQVFFSEKELKALFNKHGLTKINFRYQGFLAPVFAQVILYPQFIFYPLSVAATYADRLLDIILPGFLKKLSFNIIASGTFRK